MIFKHDSKIGQAPITAVKPLSHPIVYACTSWLQKKLADLYGTLKLH